MSGKVPSCAGQQLGAMSSPPLAVRCGAGRLRVGAVGVMAALTALVSRLHAPRRWHLMMEGSRADAKGGVGVGAGEEGRHR